LFRAEPLRDEAGQIVNWYETDPDIEDLKRESELRRMTDAISQAIVVQRPDGTPIYANQVPLEYTGLTLEASRRKASASGYSTRMMCSGCGRSAKSPRKGGCSHTPNFEEHRLRMKSPELLALSRNIG
jgi:hypothetical protein